MWKKYIILALFLTLFTQVFFNFELVNWFILKSWEYTNLNSDWYIDYENDDYYSSDDSTIDATPQLSVESNWKTTWYYIYDYPQEYYDIQDEMKFDINKCYEDENWTKYCKTKFTDDAKYNINYRTYNCHYYYPFKATVCRYSFKKTKKYIWPKYTEEEIFKNLPDFTKSVDKYWFRIFYIPRNAHMSTSWTEWECDWWYEKNSYGNYCQKIRIPVNWHISSTWKTRECDYGYLKEDDSCEKIIVPDHAYLTSGWKSWQCEYWYKINKEFDTCVKK